jgi:endonuclease YncB( thermonuclease family)
MSSPYYLCITGKFQIISKQPDGDSVRFIADDLGLYQKLQRSYRLKPSKDGSVQLRLEGIDSPELHYGSEAQPLGTEARDQLLEELGFRQVTYLKEGSLQVTSSEPEYVRGAIFSKQAETNGRPVSYLILEKDFLDLNLKPGDWNYISEAILQKTLNYKIIKSGFAYYISYSSMPKAHCKFFRSSALVAQSNNLGVWKFDCTNEFILEKQESIDEKGQLIFPKLFRRCTDYLKWRDTKNFKGDLKDWLLAQSRENDKLILNDLIELSLSDLIQQKNRRIIFQANLMDVVFLEK